jgi:midasin
LNYSVIVMCTQSAHMLYDLTFLLFHSVLEPSRTVTLAERGGEGAEVLAASSSFLFVATMNPGGDFGKKELSPALTNRFTVIWVPALENVVELFEILKSRLQGK